MPTTRPSAWVVVATVSYQDENGVSGMHQVPTFILSKYLGLCNEHDARASAKRVIDPLSNMTLGPTSGRSPKRGETIVVIDVIREEA